MFRIAVNYQGQPLMPMKSNRVYKFIQSGKGKIRYDRKLNIHYLQLLEAPSDYETQDITLGIDPGSSFDGLSIVSKDTHHINIELVQRAKKGKTAIKTLKQRQATTRRTRRSRLRHRRCRFSNRTKETLTPTIKANVDFRKCVITRLCKLYPINKIVIEDVKFNHYKNTKGRAFSLVEQGKTELYNWIRSKGLELELYDGFNTKKLRVNTFGGDPKVSNKGSRSFEAHCIDSFVLACNKDYVINTTTGEVLLDQPVVTNELDIRKSVIFIEKIVKIRRRLISLKKIYTTKNNSIGPQYYRLAKGGIKVPYENISSHRNICRVKIDDDHSNHPRQWLYIDNGFAEKFKHIQVNYGGTTYKKTFFIDGEWSNRCVKFN